MIAPLLYLLVLFLPLISADVAADYQDGLNAYSYGDYSTAMREWRAVADAPADSVIPTVYAETHYAIAMLYWQGQGVTRDYHKAHDWLSKAADLNHAGAQAKLGYMHTDGLVVVQDFDQAFEWFGKAAKQGNVDGLYNLGIFYLYGWGTEKDPTMAAQYLAAASALGDDSAEEALQQVLLEIENQEPPAEPAPASDESLVGPAPTDGSSPAWLAPAESPSPVLEDEAWILAQDPGHYTIQVIALSSLEKILTLIEGFEQLAPVASYTLENNDKQLYVLVQGSYADVDAARAARDAFPNSIQNNDLLWIRQFVRVQELIEASR